jgi:hypothetical protein
VNDIPGGLAVELVNNDGVAKPYDGPAHIDPSYSYTVQVTSTRPCSRAFQWTWNVDVPLELQGNSVNLTLAPGDTGFVQFVF